MAYLDDLRAVAVANREELESDLEMAKTALRHKKSEVEELERLVERLQALIDLSDASVTQEHSERVSLYEAMIVVIRESPLKMMRASDIANEINRRRLYRMGDGRPVEAQQVRVRVQKRPDLFERDGTFIKLASPGRS